MPIRWSAVQVSEAADKLEEIVNQAIEPLVQALNTAEEARKIKHLPQYVDQDFTRFISEVERAIGGTRWNPVGNLRAAIKSIRDDIPEGAIDREKGKTKYGVKQSML